MRYATFTATLLALAGAAFACGGGSSGPPTPAGTPTPTVPPPATIDAGRADDFRVFAAEIESALRDQDDSFFLDRALTRPVVCNKQLVEAPEPGDPVCESEDEIYNGLPIGRWRSDQNVIPVDAAVEAIGQLSATSIPEESDDFGDGSPRVYAIAIGRSFAHAILTAIIERPAGFPGEGGLRIVFLTTWSYQGERWRMTFLLEAANGPEEFLIPCDPAVEFLDTDAWERYPDATAPRGDQQDCPF